MNFKEWLELNEVKDACYHKVKKRYRVFPSAYASGALVKCRKKGAKNWGKSKKKMKLESSSLGFPRLSGWLSPSGKFYQSDKVMDHFGLIQRTAELKRNMPPDFDAKILELERKEISSQRAEEGEHPEWHWYEMLKYDIEQTAYNEMYKKGYLRVALSKQGMYFEGTPQGIKGSYQKAKDLADQYGLDAFFEKVSLNANEQICNEALRDRGQYDDATKAMMALHYSGFDVENASSKEIEHALKKIGKNPPEGVSSGLFAARIRSVAKGNTQPEDFKEGTFDLEKEQGLRGWFKRNRGKGWVDCKASRKGNIVPCGRKSAGKGAERKYPACRPTLSACNKKGTKRKKSSKRISWE